MWIMYYQELTIIIFIKNECRAISMTKWYKTHFAKQCPQTQLYIYINICLKHYKYKTKLY